VDLFRAWLRAGRLCVLYHRRQPAHSVSAWQGGSRHVSSGRSGLDCQKRGTLMSCGVGDSSCETPRRRGALIMLAVMTAIFIALSIFSFLDSRGQTTPDTITYGKYTADQGKRVFQAYNCMGCHTMVGNGGY